MTDPAKHPALHVDVHLPLDRFDLEIAFDAHRPVTGIFGPSGAGKTSLLETLAGLRRGARGTVRLGGVTWLDATLFLPPEERRIGYVPQESLLFPHLDVRGNLLAGARRARAAGADPEADLERVAGLLELGHLLARDVVTLSGGERKRVALGRALCSAPRLLLLDEPLAALDLPLRRRLLPVLRRVREELTVPMLVVSHDPVEVQALCDEVIVLREGRQIARGEPRAVLTDAAVFPLAEEEWGDAGLENLMPARVLRHEDGLSVLGLGTGMENGLELRVFRFDAAPGTELMVGISSNEMLLATEEPVGLSARNVLPARIREIRAVGDRRLVLAELVEGVPPLAVAVSEGTPSRLGLDVGRRIHLVMKAASCRIYGKE